MQKEIKKLQKKASAVFKDYLKVLDSKGCFDDLGYSKQYDDELEDIVFHRNAFDVEISFYLRDNDSWSCVIFDTYNNIELSILKNYEGYTCSIRDTVFTNVDLEETKSIKKLNACVEKIRFDEEKELLHRSKEQLEKISALLED